MTHLVRGCKFCLSKTKVVFIAGLVDVILYVPIHLVMESLDLL